MAVVSRAKAKIKEIQGADPTSAFERVACEPGPAVMRGLVSEWPLVRKASESSTEAGRYLLEFYQGAPVTAFNGPSEASGRIFYTDQLAATNFTQIKTRLDRVLDHIRETASDDAPPTIYMGSMALDYCLPGLRDRNALPTGDNKATVRIWIGNRSTVAAHYDVLENIACVCAGRRRFTLFPPDQLANLYVGPIDFTPAGQAISLVDINDPDLDQYPRFAEALEHAQTAELGPGDALYIPSMWWHHVEGLERFNILINHWWRNVPAHMGAPGDALLHAILDIRDLPEAQRKAWKDFFDYYVFDYGPETVAHIPEQRRGVLGALDEDMARTVRASLRNKLNR